MANVIPMQTRWAEENGVDWHPETFMQRHALAFAQQYQPEVVFVNDFNTFGPDWCTELRAKCPSVRLVLGWCATVMRSLDKLAGFDLVLTSSKALGNQFRAAGFPVEILRHAFDPRVLERISFPSVKPFPLSFLGSVLYGRGLHGYRAQVVEALISEVDMAVFAPGFDTPATEVFLRRFAFDSARALAKIGVPGTILRKLPGVRKALLWPNKPLYRWQDPIGRRSRGAKYGLAMYQALAESRSTVNVHGDVAGNFTGNIRLFEATGIGSCLLTDWKEDLHELFIPDSEVVTFRSVAECVDKAKWLLQNPAACESIGTAGQRRTLRDHSYEKRAAELNDIIRRHLRGGAHRAR